MSNYTIRKNTILVNKENKHIKVKVIHVHNSGRMFKVQRIDAIAIGYSNFNFDHIYRHYDVLPLLSDTLKKL